MNEEEHEYLLNELWKSKLGRKALRDSAKAMKKYKFPKLNTTDVITGGLPTGAPFRINDEDTNPFRGER